MARTTGSDDLFKLIHSLSPEERGYFKKLSGRHSAADKIYVRIFDDIVTQAEFEETSLKKKYANYVVLKVRLFDQILQSLVLQQKDDHKLQLLQEIMHISLLRDKGLSNKAEQVAQKALDRSLETGEFALAYELTHLVYHLRKQSWKPGDRLRHIRQYEADCQEVIAKMLNREQYVLATQKLMAIELDHLSGSQNAIDIDKMPDIRFLRDKTRVLSVSNERHRLLALRQYYTVKSDAENFVKASKDLYAHEMSLWQNDDPLRSAEMLVKVIAGYVSALIIMTRSAEADEVVEQLNTIKLPGKTLRDENALRYTYLKQYTLWALGKHKQGMDFSREMLNSLNRHKDVQRYRSYFMEVLRSKLLFEFSCGDFKSMQLTIHQLDEMNVKSSYPNYLKSIEILNILSLADIKNYAALKKSIALLPEKTRNIALSSSEKSVLATLKKIRPDNEKEIWKQMKESLVADPVLIFGQPTMLYWVESKLTKKSIGTIIQARGYSWK